MARNKYAKDYRLVEQFDLSGRVRTGYEYIGKDYRYTTPEIRRQKTLAAGGLVFGWLCFLGALLPVSAAMHTFYVSFPFIFAAIPLGSLADLAITVFPRPEPLEHRHADKLANRLPPAALAVTVLSGAALLGEGIGILTGAVHPVGGDLIFALCAAGTAAAGIFIFSLRRRFETEARERETAEPSAE